MGVGCTKDSYAGWSAKNGLSGLPWGCDECATGGRSLDGCRVDRCRRVPGGGLGVCGALCNQVTPPWAVQGRQPRAQPIDARYQHRGCSADHRAHRLRARPRLRPRPQRSPRLRPRRAPRSICGCATGGAPYDETSVAHRPTSRNETSVGIHDGKPGSGRGRPDSGWLDRRRQPAGERGKAIPVTAGTVDGERRRAGPTIR
jgi:hypothetical protein